MPKKAEEKEVDPKSPEARAARGKIYAAYKKALAKIKKAEAKEEAKAEE